jgi:Leucine-rich repeat (LRR) protein
METTQQFLERTLSTNGTLTQVGTPQNQAFTALQASFPNLTPMSGNQVEIAQIYALNTMYFSLNGTAWRMRTGWAGATDPCVEPIWFGVRCDASGMVIELDLTANDLMGPLPSEIQGLSNLGKNSRSDRCPFPSPAFAHRIFVSLSELLVLADNGIAGGLPNSIGSLSRLRRLDYSSNFMTLTLPASLGTLTALTSLTTTFNEQSGTIPMEIGQLTNLQSLELGDNQYSGTLPVSIGSLAQLRTYC